MPVFCARDNTNRRGARVRPARNIQHRMPNLQWLGRVQVYPSRPGVLRAFAISSQNLGFSWRLSSSPVLTPER